MDFKNYKEKQQYYKERAKEKKWFFVSCDPLNNKIERKKGSTYVKPKKEK